MRGKLPALLGLWSSLWTSRTAGAEPKDVDTVVVTGTRTPEQSQRATVKTDVVTREEAERRGATTVAEALSTQPGVQVNPGAYGFLGGISAIQIQGFDLSRVLVLEDGEPVMGAMGGGIDLATISMTDVERIEIVTGPTSALYGSSAIGGVVNIITAPPKAEGTSGRARAELRSHHEAVAQGSGAYRKDLAWFSVDLGYTRRDGVAEDSSRPDLQIPKSARSVLGVRGGARLGSRVDVQGHARWLHQDLEGLESRDYPGLGRFLSDTPDTSNRLALQGIMTAGSGSGSGARVSVGLQQASNASSTLPRGSGLGQVQRSSQSMPSLEATTTLADGARTWVAGARYEAQRLSQTLEQRQMVGSEIVPSTEVEVAPAWLWSAAAYGQLQWKLAEGLTLLPGARFEYHRTYGLVVAPRLAAAFRPVSAWTFRLSAGRGYRTPSAQELGFNFDHSVYGYRVLGNPNIRPERSWGLNGDITFRLGERFTLRAGAFANWVDDLIDIDLSAGQSTGNVVTYSYANFERVRTLGALASVACRLSERTLLELAYDYLWTHDDVHDVPLSGRAPHTLTAALRGGLFWEIEGSVRARLVSHAFVDATTRSPGYNTVDLRVSRPIWRAVQAYAGVLNALDVHQVAGVVGDLRPPVGRMLYGGVRADFPWETN
jgi:outer membrane receptor for ferrienterochelin and colicins